jgi:hypothetical protein
MHVTTKTHTRTQTRAHTHHRLAPLARHRPPSPAVAALRCRQDGARLVLCEELCAGGELFDRIVSKKKYSELHAREVVKLLVQVCAQLASHSHTHTHTRTHTRARTHSRTLPLRDPRPQSLGCARARPRADD